MRKIIIVLFVLLFFIPNKSYAQFWPFNSMNRFGNTVYYEMTNNNEVLLKGSNKIFDKNIENRYFDILSNQKEISIKINDTILNFTQRKRREPKNNKEILLYSKRKLKNSVATIKYLKLLEFKENVIVAEATIKYKKNLKKRTKEIVEIDKNQLEGIFLGSGKNYRLITSILASIGGIIFVLLI